MKRIVVLSGAGISAESGINTFRDGDGLWEKHRVEDVATPEAFARNPALVLRFYNERRKKILEVAPNDAHKELVRLENKYHVDIITQNIDDLHERAGSKNVTHLHGEIFKMCSSMDKDITYPIQGDIKLGHLAPDGHQLRPFIVWFGEAVPAMEEAIQLCEKADILLVIGTSLQVYPAASLVHYVPDSASIYIIDKKVPAISRKHVVRVEENATIGVCKVVDLLLSE